MASSIQTLVKILRLEQEKGYQNKAVIGGFARFSYHWSREAHSQAKTDAHHDLVDEIAEALQKYEAITEAERPAAVEAIITLATGQPSEQDAAPPVQNTAPVDDVGIGMPDDDDSGAPPPEQEDDFLPPAQEESHQPVRERRGYAWQQHMPASPGELNRLDEPVTTISGVGPRRAEQLERLGIETVWDMLMMFPRRYDDYSRMKFVKDLEPDDTVSVIGMLEDIAVKQTRRGRKRVEAYLRDRSGRIRLNWFNQEWMARQLQAGQPYVVSGTVGEYLGWLVLNNPRIDLLDTQALHAGRIVPIYPLTEGLSEKVMRNLMKGVVDEWAPRLPDHLPLTVREEADLMDYWDAVSQAHFPDTWQDKEDALHRLAFDELFVLHLAMLRRRDEWQAEPGTPVSVEDGFIEAFEEMLPFEFTGAQQRAIAEIRADIAQATPMNRLIQGDVGSGKTVVATLAMAMAVASGQQAALMAPTGILTEQHHAEISELFAQFFADEPVEVALLTGRVSGSERERIYGGLADGSIQAVIGTHALIQPEVAFEHLGLVVVDEQHRFGVAQRGSLREKAAGGNPHLLVMTATPIPRTLALTMHADLDLTIIDELPPGRQPIATRVLQAKERERAYAFLRTQIEKGRQAYIICPLVEDSDSIEARSAVTEYERLQNIIFPDLNLSLLHGRMKGDEKEAAMEAFYRGETDILVSTTVIEVGVNVPNATVMMVENAPRFGLAQLHQLRGRVGRGAHQSTCLLLSDRNFRDLDPRLEAMERSNDGFELARVDVEQRGPGDLIGHAQSGFGGHLDFTHLFDARLIDLVQRLAHDLHDRDTALTQYPLLAQRVDARIQAFGDVS